MGMNTQDLARAVASAKKMLDAHGWVGSERRVQVAKALLAVAADIDALHSRHAAMVGELKELRDKHINHSDPDWELGDGTPDDAFNEGWKQGCRKTAREIDTILSQHADEGKEVGRG